MRAQFRHAVAKHLGTVLTPEVAAAIEAEAFEDHDQAHDPCKFGSQQCGRLTFQAERFAAVLPELHVLHGLHWQETEAHRHGLAMDPDYEGMEAAERAGRMIQFTARDGAALVGNLRMYVRTSMHTKTLLAVEDTLYVLPEYRKGRNALRFMQFVEASLKAIGVREIRADTKHTAPAGALLFKFMGYQPVSTQYVKFLEE